MQKKQIKFTHTRTHTHTHQITSYMDFLNGAAVLYMLLDKNVSTHLKSSSFLVCIQLNEWNSL